MSWDYLSIKELAKSNGARITDFLALAPQNDPFYTGTPKDVENARWFAQVWERAGYTSGVHLRRVHYWTVSQSPAVSMPNGLPYENTEKCWDYLVQASKLARYLGLVRIESIVDKKNPQPHIHATYSPQSGPRYEISIPDLDDPYVWIDGINNSTTQPYHIEIWCEKSTMDDVLLPIARQHSANLVTFEGEVSISACRDLVARIEQSGGKPTRIWYISDFDPAGNSMPVAMSRKVEFLLQYYSRLEFDVKVTPIALTAQQIARYKLPRIPIKETEKRAARFELAFGEGAVELDALEALHPGTLGRLLRNEIKAYYSQEAADEARDKSEALRAAVSTKIAAITAKYQAQIEAIRSMLDELRAIDVETDEYQVHRFEPHVDDDSNDWLFDSARGYQEQIVRYKAHKGIEVQNF